MAGLVLKESKDIANLLKAIPHREQRGLFSNDVCWTCVDFTTDWVAVGTDSGWLYLYDRFEETVKHRLTTQPSDRNCVTKVKLKTSVDYVVAMGTASGFISIFQLPVLNLSGFNAKLHVFAIRDLHHSSVTCLEWSQNAMKLFSGDEDGVVICTEIDYTTNQSRSYVICKEPHSIVQLSYAHKTLLVSTRWRAVLCKADDSMNVTQVGRKDRKVLGPFGATFFPGSFQAQEAVLYCARPNLSLWKADITGTVALTMMFKELAANLVAPLGVSLVPDLETKGPQQESSASPQFSQLLVFGRDLLLSYFENGLFVLNPRSGQFVCYQTGLPDIADVAVNEEEVFLLMRANRGSLRYLAQNAFRAKRPLVGGIHTQLLHKEPPFERDIPAKVSESIVPTAATTTTTTNKTATVPKSIIGVLKEISYAMPPIEDGTTSDDPVLQAVTPEAGEEAKDDETAVENALSSIPIIRLDPADFKPLVVQPQAPISEPLSTGLSLQESKVPAQPASDVGQIDGVANCPAAGDDIVFESVLKKIKKKKTKSRSSRAPDVVSISSGELGPRDRSASPANLQGRSASQHRSSGPVDLQQRSASHFLQQPSMSRTRSPIPADFQRRSASPFLKELSTSQPRSISPLPSFLHPSYTEPVDFLLPLTKHQDSQSRGPPLLVSRGVETPQTVQTAAPTSSALSNSERDVTEPSAKESASMLQAVGVVTSCQQPQPTADAGARLGCVDTKSTTEKEHKATSSDSQTLDKLPDKTKSSNRRALSKGDPSLTLCQKALQTARSLTDLRKVGSQTEQSKTKSHVESPMAGSLIVPPKTVEPQKTESQVEPPKTGSQVEPPKTGSQIELLKTENQMLEETLKHAEPAKVSDQRELHKTGNQKDVHKAENQSSLSTHSTSSSSLTNLTSSDNFQSIYHRTNYDEISPEKESTAQPREPAPPPKPVDVCARPQTVEVWLEFYLPAPIKSLSLSSKYAWCVDRLDHVHYALFSQPLKWVQVDQPGHQVSVSPNGSIVWLLYKNSAYSANKISPRSPAGAEWREVAREVSSLSVDNHVAWYSKLNGEVMIQKGLTKDRTSFRSQNVSGDQHIAEVVCGSGIVWAITDDRIILVRAGVEKGTEEGTSWMPLQGQGNRLMPFSLSIGCEGIVWMMDISGRAWYTTNVTASNPHGSGLWWEISVTDCSASEVSIPGSKMKLPQTLTRSFYVESGGTVAANKDGEVWIYYGKGQSVYASNGSVAGHRWETVTPSGMLSTTKWRRISCCQGDGESSAVWLEQSNGDIFCLIVSAAETRILEISPPHFGEAAALLASTTDALWCLLASGRIYVRKGMSSLHVQGVEWTGVDLSQLGNVKIVHISVSRHNVWAVDNVGNIYLRIGVKPPSNSRINPAWVEVDRKNLPTGVQITQCVTSPNSAMVWAVDSKRNVYIRAGVTESLPLGTNWITISGGAPDCIQVSNHNAYTVNSKGEVFMRYGLSRTNPCGDSWKRIPGKCNQIAVTGADDLWSLDKDGQLYRRHTYNLEFSNSHRVTKELSKKDSIDNDWEIV